MHLKYNIYNVKAICLVGLLLLLLTVTSSAQRAEITIKCVSDSESPESAVKAGNEKPKDKKPKAKKNEDKSLRLKLNDKSEKTSGQENFEGEAGIIPINCTALAQITVYSGPPNTTVIFTVTQTNPANIVTMSSTSQGSFGTSLNLPIQLNSSGQGIGQFYIRGVGLGETTINAYGNGADTNPLDIIVVECKCPVIPVNTPPRN